MERLTAWNAVQDAAPRDPSQSEVGRGNRRHADAPRSALLDPEM